MFNNVDSTNSISYYIDYKFIKYTIDKYRDKKTDVEILSK